MRDMNEGMNRFIYIITKFILQKVFLKFLAT